MLDIPKETDPEKALVNFLLLTIPEKTEAENALVNSLSTVDKYYYELISTHNWNFQAAGDNHKPPVTRETVSKRVKNSPALTELYEHHRERVWLQKVARAIAALPKTERSVVAASVADNDSIKKAYSARLGVRVPLVLPRTAFDPSYNFLTRVRGAAFCILLVYDGNTPSETALSIVAETRGGVVRHVLRVTLNDKHARLGIFSNAGKQFLNWYYKLDDAHIRTQLLGGSTTLHQQMLAREMGAIAVPRATNHVLPWRWASGGILPVVRYRGQSWVALFFRDIPPIGWNVANGASESLEETTQLDRVCGGEFSEEMTLLRGPQPIMNIVRQAIIIDKISGSPMSRNPDKSDASANDHDEKKDDEYVKTYRSVRAAHDGIAISWEPEATRFRNGHYEMPNGYPVEINNWRTGGVIWSLNPLECGIEVIRIFSFEMDDTKQDGKTVNEWLADGEIYPSSSSPFPYQLRRPVVLLNVKYLLGVFRGQNNSLGNLCDDATSPECKRLAVPPENSNERSDFHLFTDVDGKNVVEVREGRLTRIRNRLNELDQLNNAANEERTSLNAEQQMITTWLANYSGAFMEASQNHTISDNRLLRLCPVTWKTLEIALMNGYLPE